MKIVDCVFIHFFHIFFNACSEMIDIKDYQLFISVVMLDEAHERSLQTDMALGLMKKMLKKRKDLRVIVSSATLDAQVVTV